MGIIKSGSKVGLIILYTLIVLVVLLVGNWSNVDPIILFLFVIVGYLFPICIIIKYTFNEKSQGSTT